MKHDSVIAVDGMGGDLAPEAVLRGLEIIGSSDFHFIIFGDEARLSAHRKLLPSSISYEFRHTDVEVTADMDVMSGIKCGMNSSMGLAIQAVRDGEAKAVLSSGNTGLYMALAKIILKTIDGIDRPAFASIIPGLKSGTVCLDLGANAECSVKNLVDFAIMGDAVARSLFGKDDVKIALLNIGSEQIKGSTLVRKTSEILEEVFDNYVGFVEGNDICNNDIDVIVTDGFTGNVFLKTIEGTAKFIVAELKNSLSNSFMSKIGAMLAISSINSFKAKMDPRLYNAAILVGLNGVVVKSHGNSDGVGFANAIKFTINTLRDNMFTRIQQQLSKSHLIDALDTYSKFQQDR